MTSNVSQRSLRDVFLRRQPRLSPAPKSKRAAVASKLRQVIDNRDLDIIQEEALDSPRLSTSSANSLSPSPEQSVKARRRQVNTLSLSFEVESGYRPPSRASSLDLERTTSSPTSPTTTIIFGDEDIELVPATPSPPASPVPSALSDGFSSPASNSSGLPTTPTASDDEDPFATTLPLSIQKKKIQQQTEEEVVDEVAWYAEEIGEIIKLNTSPDEQEHGVRPESVYRKRPRRDTVPSSSAAGQPSSQLDPMFNSASSTGLLAGRSSSKRSRRSAVVFPAPNAPLPSLPSLPFHSVPADMPVTKRGMPSLMEKAPPRSSLPVDLSMDLPLSPSVDDWGLDEAELTSPVSVIVEDVDAPDSGHSIVYGVDLLMDEEVPLYLSEHGETSPVPQLSALLDDEATMDDFLSF